MISNSSTENNNNPIPKFGIPAVNTIIDTSQPKIYTNTRYTSFKSDVSDASDAFSTTNGKTKAELVGKPEIPCKDCIEFDLSLHYVAKHKLDLIRLPIGKSSIDDRADYAVKLSKKKLVESSLCLINILFSFLS
jgi:hypothetical protein